MTKKIGIYPGTFNPIHIGHIAFSKKAQSSCGLDSIVFLPEQHPRSKPNVTPLEVRVRDIKTEVQQDDRFAVYSPSSRQFTVKDTLPEIIDHFPDSELTFLLGSDVVIHLHHWPDLPLLLRHARFAIGMRSHESINAIAAAFQSIETQYNMPVDYTIVHTPHTDVSSTAIRQIRQSMV